MRSRPVATAMVLAALTLTACAHGVPTDPSEAPNAPGATVGGSSGTAGGSAGGTGGQGSGGASSTGAPPTTSIQPVDPTVFTPSDTGSAANVGTSTAVVFATSGVAQYGNGTCGANGTWTDSLGTVHGAHDSHCIAYWSDGRAGNNGKGQCVSSPAGYPGLWLNPAGNPTSPYHTKCLELGATTSTLSLSFPAQATVYTANDGSGRQVLDFDAGGTTVAQLVYQGTASDYTTGAGVLSGTDGSATWTIDFSQTALNYTGGLANGNVIDAATTAGIEVVACEATVGCSLITLKLTVAP